jgi:hypothetical protein
MAPPAHTQWLHEVWAPRIAVVNTRRGGFDVSGRLSQVLDGNGTLVADYRYDPFGRCISKSVYRDLQGEELAQPQSRWFVYAAEGLVAETTGAAQYENFYGWQPDGLWGTSPVFVRRLAENGWGKNDWYLVDHLGTPRQLVDSACKLPLLAGFYHSSNDTSVWSLREWFEEQYPNIASLPEWSTPEANEDDKKEFCRQNPSVPNCDCM